MPKIKKKNNKEEKPATETKVESKGLEGHIREPLFAISVFVFILSILRSLFGGDLTIAGGLTILMFLSGAASVYFVYAYFKGGRKDYVILGIPLLIFITGFFSWTANQNSGWTMRDFAVFSIMFGIFLLFYAIAVHRIIKWSSAAILAITLSTLLIHVAPAYTFSWAPWSGKYFQEITDPYWHYKLMNFIVNNGYAMETDLLTYPTEHLNFSDNQYLIEVFAASIALVLKPLGISTFDIAMLYEGVGAALIVLVAYLLMRDLFADFEPYNKAAAVLFAFMLMLSPGFASKAIATDAKNGPMGMFLVVGSLFLIVNSFKRKSILFSVIAGFSFLLLKLGWAGYDYAIVVLGIFTLSYAIINFIHKKNCIEYIPYFIIPVIISQLFPIILHARGEFPHFKDMPLIFLLPAVTPVIVSFALEAIRAFKYGKLQIDAKTSGERLENFLERHIFPSLGIIIVAVILFSVITHIDPGGVVRYVEDTIVSSAKQAHIIERTTAEQNATCDKIDVGCIKRFYDTYGIAVYFGLAMIPILLYFTFLKRSAGAIFVLAWSIPMVYGYAYRSQYIFNASVPIIALGSTIGLIIAMNRKDIETFRILPLLVLIGAPIYLSWGSSMPLLDTFGGARQMQYGGINTEALFWDPTLQWLKTTPENTTILTWWDYGHMITAVTGRISMADNLKGRYDIVQDLAVFHVLETNETKALDIARKYGANYVIIDWTMIGKSGAPHFIATSNITTGEAGEYMGYSQCGFSPENSMLKPKLVANSDGGFDSLKKVVFMCNVAGPYNEYIGAIIFDITNDRLGDVSVSPLTVSNGGLVLDPPVKWSIWRQEHKASILGVQSFRDILGNALNYGTDKYIGFPTFGTLIYVPPKFNDYMMTKLYLGDHMEEYKQFGLTNINRLEHIKLVDGFLGNTQDNSYFGYVKAYKINYPEEETAGNQTTGI